MAKLKTMAWRFLGTATRLALRMAQCVPLCVAMGWLIVALPAAAQEPASAPASAASAMPQAAWLRVPRIQGRVTSAELGLVINTDDPYSVAVGEYYVRRREIPEQNVVRVRLPLRATLTTAEFDTFNTALNSQMPPAVQGLALAWREPYAVECNSITAALALGFQPRLCAHSCAVSQTSVYFNHAGSRPFSELGLRPSMLLAARSVASAEALIERGIEADHSQPSEAGANAWFISTPDVARNVRLPLFPPASRFAPLNLEVRRESSQSLPPLKRTLIYQTGLKRVDGIDVVDWLPGALADHLTSFGGLLDAAPQSGQMSAIDWIEAGATASYGTVSEPCNHQQKFPHPQLLLLYYAQGATALEAYWRSVAWSGQGVFIGEPLAAPYSPKGTARKNDE